MQVVTYEYKKIERIVDIINGMSFHGFDSARAIAEIGDILDTGMRGEISDNKKEADENNGLDKKEVRQDKLEE